MFKIVVDFLYANKRRENRFVLYIQKIEVVGSEVSEKRVWVQRLAQMEKKAG
jgi:hypothetical protein